MKNNPKNSRTSNIQHRTSELEELRKQIRELTEALQRERADALNIRRRHEDQLGSIKTLVQANVIREFLPVIDSCERLLHHISTVSKDGTWKQGVEQIYKQLEKALADMGVERIKTVGEEFNPKLHEAIGIDESSEALAKGEDAGGSSPAGEEVVCEELQPGYKLGDQIIRHAIVKVKMQSASKPIGEEEEKK